MSQMMHIVRKDVRRLRWILALGLLVLIARVLLAVNGARAADDSVATGLLLQQTWGTMAVIELLVMALIVAQLVLEEPLVGFTPFWLTRPYAARSLLAAKLLFAVVALVALPLTADLLTMSLFNVGPQAIVKAGITAAVGYASWMLSLMVLATLTPSLAAFVLATLGIVVANSVVGAAFVGFAGIRARPNPSYSLQPAADTVTPVVVLIIVYLCAALSVVVYQYHHRRWRVSAALAVAGLVGTVAVTTLWPWSFVRSEPVRVGAWGSSVAVAHDPSWGTKVSDVVNVSRQMGERWRYVSAHLTFSGLPSQMLLQSTGIRSKLRFPDGSLVESGQRGGGSLDFTPAAAEAALGARVLVTRESYDRPQWSPMITISEQDYARHRGQSGRLETDIDFFGTQMREVATLPVAVGASFDRGTSRLEIAAVQQGTDGRNVVMRRWQARSLLSRPGTPQQFFALRRRSHDAALMGGTSNNWQLGSRPNAATMLLGLPLSRIGSPFLFAFRDDGFSVGTQYLQFPGRGFGIVPGVDLASFDDAELVVLEVVPAGVVTRHLVIDPFVVP